MGVELPLLAVDSGPTLPSYPAPIHTLGPEGDRALDAPPEKIIFRCTDCVSDTWKEAFSRTSGAGGLIRYGLQRVTRFGSGLIMQAIPLQRP